MAQPDSTRRAWIDLFLASFVILFLELAMIRWLPANVKIVSYFTNLVLMAAFLGVGTGCLLARLKVSLLPLVPVLLGIIQLLIAVFADVYVAFSDARSVHVWIQRDTTAEAVRQLGVVPVVAIFFVILALTFVPLGQAMGRCFARLPSLQAYSVDILGSLCGSLAFALCSWLSAPPIVWFGGCALIVLVLLRGRWAWLAVSAVIFSGMLVMIGVPAEHTSWSPYYRVTQVRAGPLMHVMVNGSFHQTAFDMRPAVRQHDSTVRNAFARFAAPYRLFRPHKALILGAGTGNDVYAAVQSGVAEIHAVEIDPQILELGREANSARPYASPRVVVFNTDARSHLRRTSERYDLVVLGTLDSQSLLSAMSTIRLDNYVYTKECFEDIRSVLAEGGTVVVLYASFQPWIGAKIFKIMEAVFGVGQVVARWDDEPFVYNMTYIAGAGVESERIPPGWINYTKIPDQLAGLEIPTDDWPYLYLINPKLPSDYWVMLAILLVSSLLLVGGAVLVSRSSRLSLQPSAVSEADDHRRAGPSVFFLLGVGFMLLEAKSVTEVSLLYGSTWIVNVVVFASILLTIFLANLTVLKWKLTSIRVPFWVLITVLLFNYFFPLRVLLAAHPTLQLVLATLFIGLPIGAAGCIFAILFHRTVDAERLFGANLLGAMVGGVMEYFSIITGLKALFLIALVAYLLVALRASRTLRPRACR